MARRPRPADPAAAHEETNMWNSILVDLKKARDLNIKSKEIIKQAVEVESTMGKCTSFHVSHICLLDVQFVDHQQLLQLPNHNLHKHVYLSLIWDKWLIIVSGFGGREVLLKLLSKTHILRWVIKSSILP